MASSKDHFDEVRGEEGKADGPADMRHLLPIALGDCGDGLGTAAP
jgi:hypothetical protein